MVPIDAKDHILLIFAGDHNYVSQLNTSGVNMQDSSNNSLLHAAVYCGFDKLVKVLIDKGARVNAKDNMWRTALHRGCTVGVSDIIRLLLFHGADVSARDKSWQTPLHLAASNGHLACVQSLLDQPDTNLNVTDHNGRSPLHHAAAQGHLDIVHLLLDRGASVNMIDSHNRTAMHWAAAAGHEKIIELLYPYMSNVNCADKDQYTPLHVACALGHLESTKLLVSLGADVNALTIQNYSTLHLACLNNHETIVQFLLDQIISPIKHMNASNNANIKLDRGVEDEQLNLYIDAIVRCSSSDGLSPIHLASIGNGRGLCLSTILDSLREMRPDYEIDLQSLSETTNGISPLHFAALVGSVEMGELLLKHGISVTAKDVHGNTALHLASDRHHDAFVEMLLKNGCPWDICDNHGSTALHRAALAASDACLMLLLKTACAQHTSNTAMYDVSEIKQHLATVVNSVDHLGRTILHSAALGHSLLCVYKLLLAGANPHSVDKHGRTVLYYAISGCDSSLSDDILSYSFRNWNAVNYNTVRKIVSVFLRLGVKPDCMDHYGCSALHFACAYANSYELVQSLLQHNADPLRVVLWPPKRFLSTFEEGCAVDESSASTNQEPTLYDKKLSNESYLCGPIHFAVKNKNKEGLEGLLDHIPSGIIKSYVFGDWIVRLPLEKSMHNFFEANIAPSPILMAVVQGNGDILKTLIEHYLIICIDIDDSFYGANWQCEGNIVEITDVDDYIKLCTLLSEPLECLTSNLDAHCTLYRWNALHYAASQGYIEVAQLLIHVFSLQDGLNLNNPKLRRNELKTKAEFINSLDEHNRTPLMLAVQNNHLNFTKFFISRYKPLVQIDIADVYGRTALHRTVANGHLDCLTLMVNSGASLGIRDFRNRHSLHLAATSGNIDVLAFIINHLKKSLKVEFDLNQHPEIVDHFHPIDECGFSPLHFAVYKGHFACMDFLLYSGWYDKPRGNVYTPLHCGAQKGYSNCLEALLVHFPPSYIETVDRLGRTALHVAAMCDQIDSVRTLTDSFNWNLKMQPTLNGSIGNHLTEPSDDEVTSPSSGLQSDQHLDKQNQSLISLARFVTKTDSYGRTALMLAASIGSVEVLHKLLSIHSQCKLVIHTLICDENLHLNRESRAELITLRKLLNTLRLDVKDTNGLTVLHHACLSSDISVFKLIESESEFTDLISIKDNLNRTPLHLAITSGLLPAVESLIDSGADLYATDTDGRIPALACTPSIKVANCVSLCLAKMFPPITEEQTDRKLFENLKSVISDEEEKARIHLLESMHLDDQIEADTKPSPSIVDPISEHLLDGDSSVLKSDNFFADTDFF